MKRKIKIILSCIIALCLTAALLCTSTNLLEKKDSDSKYTPFFEQDADFDVLFLGTSHVGYGIYPLELWNDYGIVSYNLGGHANPMATTYWVMENALDYTNPRLVVVDCFLLSYMIKTHSLFASAHYSLDAFPYSKNKLAAINDLLDDDIIALQYPEALEAAPRTHLELLWNYSIYHSRWNDLRQEDFKPVSTKEKGAEHFIGVVPTEKPDKISSDDRLEEDTVSIEYLKKIIEDCKKRNIDVLLTYLPFAAPENFQKEANRVYDIAESYGVDYINFLDMDIVNYTTDYCDSDYHLNPSGARKVTDYLGAYIMENYSIPDQRKNEHYHSWHTDYNDYANDKLESLRELESLDKYLMLLADKSYSADIEISNEGILQNDYYNSLLENLDSAGLCTVTSKQSPEADIRIIVTDRNTGEVVDDSCFLMESSFSK